MANTYFIITELINGIRLGEITPDQTIDILEKILLMLDGLELTAEEQRNIAKILRGEDA